jgi:hypothetical protein
MHADDVEFIAAVKAFRRPIDDEVETLALRGSGIRIIGFRRMFYGPLRVLLLRFKKTCKICAVGDAITLDIFNNHCTDPLQPPCSLADIPRLAPMAAGKSTITKGSVVQETYQYESLCNTELDRVLAQHAVISVVLEGNCLKVTLVHVSSMGIVSGLHDQLVHQKIRVANKRPVRLQTAHCDSLIAIKPRTLATPLFGTSCKINIICIPCGLFAIIEGASTHLPCAPRLPVSVPT